MCVGLSPTFASLPTRYVFFMHLQSLLSQAPWQRQLTTIAAFLVPALALTVASGYSYGALLLLFGALVTLPRWVSIRPDRGTILLALTMMGMALLWGVLSNPQDGWGRFDRPAKYVLAVLCLLFATAYPPRARALYWGLLAGSIGAGSVALWQVFGLGIPRATGFPSSHTSSAIQWGNLALLMGSMLALQTLVLSKQIGRARTAVAWLAVLMAFNASVLSQSRGGWLALLLALPVGFYLLGHFHGYALWRILVGMVVVLGVLGAVNHKALSERWDAMEKEVLVYGVHREADNSVGQRLEHWRFAWNVGLERPILGWGMGGYLEEKDKRVAAGQYKSAILEYYNAHNELLDMFVKAGVVGVAWLLLFYAVPLCMFWPTRSRVAAYENRAASVRAQMLALRLAGVSIPLLYVGFGLTVVFLSPNSGIMFYLFMVMLIWASLRGLDAECARSLRRPAASSCAA